VQVIEQTVKNYLEAFRTNAFSTQARYSTGDLTQLARWEGAIASAQGAPAADGDMSINSITVRALEPDVAHGDLEATVAFNDLTGPVMVDLSGPFTVQKTSSGWRLADFTRAHRSVASELFTDVSGQGESNGLTLQILGLDLRPSSVVIYAKVTNSTLQSFSAAFAPSPTLVDTAGRQHSNGVGPASSDSVVSRASLFTSFTWLNLGLPLKPQTLRLVADFDADTTFLVAHFSIPIKIGH
jgi:hypothetical protein